MTHEPINTALPASREPVVSPHQSASPRTPPATRLGAVARFVVCAWLAALPTLTLDFAVAQEPSVAEPSPVAPEPPGSAEKPSEATEAKTEGSAAQSEVSVEGATKKAGPAPVTSSRELLELFGVEASYYEHLVDDQEVDVAENEALLRTLLGINRFTAMQTFQWTKPAGSLPAMIDDPAPHRGEIVAIRGRAAQITRLEPLPEVQRIFGIPEFFRVELEATDPGAGWATAVVYTLKIPAAWRAAPTPPFGEYRTSFTGFFFKRAGAGRPVFTTTRMAWHPPGFLGDLGMDLSRFDEVQQHTRVLPREPFYELLAAMGRASKDHLKRLTASDIKSPKFDRDHIRDWFVFPWKIRAAAELGTPSPGKRLYDLLPPHVQAAVRTARPDAMPSPELMQGLIDALNAATANPALYDPASFRE
ncbi:MAG TPA: hypothetical protein VGE52_04210, partial [Pirellulales bacterium]